MSGWNEAVWVCLINGIVTVLCVAISRYLSYLEHSRTSAKITHLIDRNGCRFQEAIAQDKEA